MLNDFIKQINTDRIRDYYLSIGQGAIDLCINILAMILVERALGQTGLGIFSFILSLYFTTGYLAEFGIPGLLERGLALHPESRIKQTVNAKNAIRLTSIIIAGLFFLAAFRGAGLTTIEDTYLIYIIIGLSIPFRTSNRLKLSLLQGTGNHSQVAGLRTKKRIYYIVILFALLFIIDQKSEAVDLFRSLLTLALFIPELIQAVQLRSILKLPGIFRTGFQIKKSFETLKESRYFIFSNDAFEIILYIDFLILGMFVSSSDLGIYSEASIFARFFLLIPVSIKPVIRNMYCSLSAAGDNRLLISKSNRVSTIIFFINALLALYILIYFHGIINLFFITQGDELISFNIFCILLPGLLYFSSAMTKEPFYEAIENQRALQGILITVFIINLCLNLYLIPYAGIKGAASASMLSTLIFFIISEIKLKAYSTHTLFSWFMAGIWVSFIYKVSHYTKGYPVLTFLCLPAILFLCFYLSGFFDYKKEESTL